MEFNLRNRQTLAGTLLGSLLVGIVALPETAIAISKYCR